MVEKKTLHSVCCNMQGETSAYIDAFINLLGEVEGDLRKVPLSEEEINTLRHWQENMKQE